MSQPTPATVQHNIHLGLGEAIRRLIRVEMYYARGLTADKNLLEESHMITDALNNEYQLDLGFDCNDDGIPDSVEIFTQAVETACCRLVADNKDKKARGSSREALDLTVATAKPKAEPKKKAPTAANAAETLAASPESQSASAVVPEPKPAEAKAEKKPKKKKDEKSIMARLLGE